MTARACFEAFKNVKKSNSKCHFYCRSRSQSPEPTKNGPAPQHLKGPIKPSFMELKYTTVIIFMSYLVNSWFAYLITCNCLLKRDCQFLSCRRDFTTFYAENKFLIDTRAKGRHCYLRANWRYMPLFVEKRLPILVVQSELHHILHRE